MEEYMAKQQIESFVKIKALNQKLFDQAEENTEVLHKKLEETKAYLHWNEMRIDEEERKIHSLQENQCQSNQLFLSSLETNLKTAQDIKLLKQDLKGLFDEMEEHGQFNQVQLQSKSIGEKLKQYSNLIQDYQIKQFMELAASQENDALGREATLSEKIKHILEQLEAELQGSIENLQNNEIKASWELAGWVSLTKAEIANLRDEYEKKQVFADRTATQIQAALAQQAKSKIILQQSQDAIDQAQATLKAKQESYAAEQARRAEENAILEEVSTIFKKQISSWSDR